MTEDQKSARKRRGPRPASTYRCARRDEALRGETKTTWRGAQAIYRAYQIKPPVVKMGLFGPFSRIRPQPKTYPAIGQRQRDRAARRAARRAA